MPFLSITALNIVANAVYILRILKSVFELSLRRQATILNILLIHCRNDIYLPAGEYDVDDVVSDLVTLVHVPLQLKDHSTCMYVTYVRNIVK